jgi:hypothetical protein
MPMGAAGGAASGKGGASETWLNEDGDPFDPNDEGAPGPVLS